MKKLCALCLLFAACHAQAAGQQGGSTLSTNLSNASGLVAEGSAMVIYGSLSALAASGKIVVESVEATGEASVVVLAGASDAGRAGIRISGRALREASVVAGSAASLVAVSTGYMLVVAGKVIAFVPNEVGKALIHHSRADGVADRP